LLSALIEIAYSSPAITQKMIETTVVTVRFLRHAAPNALIGAGSSSMIPAARAASAPTAGTGAGAAMIVAGAAGELIVAIMGEWRIFTY